MTIRARRPALLSWLFVGVLLALAAALGALQYRWIGEVSQAERERLRAGLQASLQRLSQDFNAEITAACAALMPISWAPDEKGREEGYALRYAQWRHASRHPGLFRHMALAVPRGDSVALRSLDLDKQVFAEAEWPPTWEALRARVAPRLSDEPGQPRRLFGPPAEEELAVLVLPQFGPPPEGSPPPPRPRRMEVSWLILELDLDYLRVAVFPELLQRHLVGGPQPDYHAEIVSRSKPATLIYPAESERGARIGARADASVSLFELQWDQLMRRRGAPGPGGPGNGGPPRPSPPDRGRWQLSVRHRAGSLEAVVSAARQRNIAVTTAILLLMVAATAALVRFTRQAQKLAEMQMGFLTAVSHELRTPLTVITTAAHNLRGGVVSNPTQIQRYGALIQDEGQRLTTMVEQILRFARAKAGSVLGAREPLSLEAAIEEALESSRGAIEASDCLLEASLQPGLPLVLADPAALRLVLQNLLDNAAKYGRGGGWIGVFASAVREGKHALVEVRVADRGPGIPAKELEQIFDPFFRGQKAQQDQVHGAGLGLSLVKRIVEAHGGTVFARSTPGQGTEFVMRLPPAPPEQQDEFAHSLDRG